MLSFVALACALSPQMVGVRRVTTMAAPRSTALIAPMTDLTLADMGLQATLPQVDAPDAILRMTFSAARIVVGAGVTGYALQVAQLALTVAMSLRSLFTIHTVGTVRAAEQLGLALQSTPSEHEPEAGVLPRLQSASMLCYFPLEFWRWWSRLLPRIVPAAPVALRRVTASLWLLWIACTVVASVTRLRTRQPAQEQERRTLRRRLLKLALDAPVAGNFLLAQPVLPLAVIGVLGVLSSWQALQMALEAPAKPRRVRLPSSTPLFKASLSRVRRRIPLCTSSDGPFDAAAGMGLVPLSLDGLPRIPLSSSRDGLPRIPLSSSRDGLQRVSSCPSWDTLPRILPRISPCTSRDKLLSTVSGPKLPHARQMP